MAKLRLIHSFPMVYYTPRSDKWFKNWIENSTQKTPRAVFFYEKFTSVCIAVPLLQKVQCPRVERAVILLTRTFELHAQCKPVYSANISRIVILHTLSNCILNAIACHCWSKSTTVLRRVKYSSQKAAHDFFATVFAPVFKPFVGPRHVIYHWKAMD
jgi:hypothetical protein